MSSNPSPGYLRYPPQPQSEYTPYSTPPPSPSRHQSRGRRGPPSYESHWGRLMPLNPMSDSTWNFVRGRREYHCGARNSCHVRLPNTFPNDQCTITWDGTDSPGSVKVVDYAGRCGEPFGTYINGHRLQPGESYVLRHGDRIAFQGSPAMDPDEDFRLVWLQCTLEGWKPFRYVQDAVTYGNLHPLPLSPRRYLP